MRTVVTRLCAVISLAALGAAGWAYPSLLGSTGTVNLPTADTAVVQSATLALDVQDTNSDTTKSWRLLYGLTNHSEVGFAFVDTKRDTWAITAKSRVITSGTSGLALGALIGATTRMDIAIPTPPTTPTGPTGPTGPTTVAARATTLPVVPGMTNITLPSTLTYQLYVVGTCQPMTESATHPQVKASVGGNWTAMKANGNEDHAFRLFFSASLSKGRTAFVADYQTADKDIDDKPMTSMALRYALSSRLGAEIGYTNSLGVVGDRTDRLFGGISYRFGGAL